jgi:hypothetical protein
MAQTTKIAQRMLLFLDIALQFLKEHDINSDYCEALMSLQKVIYFSQYFVMRLRAYSYERELNNLRFLKADFDLILHFENPHYININRTFKAQNETKICWFKNRSLFNSRSLTKNKEEYCSKMGKITKIVVIH